LNFRGGTTIDTIQTQFSQIGKNKPQVKIEKKSKFAKRKNLFHKTIRGIDEG
jgi:hypothetical protein